MQKEEVYAGWRLEPGKGQVGSFTCSCFNSLWREPNDTIYNCHVEMDITYYKGMAGMCTIGDKEYQVEPGDIFIVRSNERHKISRVTQAGPIINIMFHPSFLWEGIEMFGLNFMSVYNNINGDFENRIEQGTPTYKKVIEVIDKIFAEFENNEYGYEKMIKMHMCMMLFTIARDMGGYEDEKSMMNVHQMDAIRRSMDYIDEHFTQAVHISNLARIANLSPNYYGTVFKQLVGVTPVEYITSKRIAYATKLLPDHKGSMLELALECGFNSTASFNRAFKLYTGQVPSKYTPFML